MAAKSKPSRTHPCRLPIFTLRLSLCRALPAYGTYQDWNVAQIESIFMPICRSTLSLDSTTYFVMLEKQQTSRDYVKMATYVYHLPPSLPYHLLLQCNEFPHREPNAYNGMRDTDIAYDK